MENPKKNYKNLPSAGWSVDDGSRDQSLNLTVNSGELISAPFSFMMAGQGLWGGVEMKGQRGRNTTLATLW